MPNGVAKLDLEKSTLNSLNWSVHSFAEDPLRCSIEPNCPQGVFEAIVDRLTQTEGWKSDSKFDFVELNFVLQKLQLELVN